MKLADYEKKHLRTMLSLAPECTLFLRRNGDFPLEFPGRIALYGSGARKTAKGGTGSGDVNSHFYTTVERGLEKVGFTVTTKEWLDAFDEIHAKARKAYTKVVRARAKELQTSAMMLAMGAVMPQPEYDLPIEEDGDAAVYVVSRVSGESGDRAAVKGDFMLSDTEVRDILRCREKYEKFMLVLNVGGAVDLSPVMEVENILLISQLGAVTGNAFAKILLGKAYPSGKLTATWSAWGDYCDQGDFGTRHDTRYREGIYVGYRYFDTVGKEPLFPFGYGLGYTDFAIGEGTVQVEKTRVCVPADVTNVGNFPGKETLQIYVSVPSGKLDQPYQTLAAFAKTKELLPGEHETIQAEFSMEELASYDVQTSSYILEKGDYLIRVGKSSRETAVCGVIRLEEDVVVRTVAHAGGTPDFEDYQPQCVPMETPGEEIPVFTIKKSDFAELTFPEPEQVNRRALEYVRGLSDEDLALTCVGRHRENKKSEVVGQSAQTVAGAGGETYHRLPGVPGLVMADGPAGLRLSRTCYRDERGVHAVIDEYPDWVLDYLPGFLRAILVRSAKKKPKGEVYYQYATAIPIGTAIAQSWNTQAAETCGDVVGEEMEHFGVHLWLAPAFNIHRNPLCGRNFEYCSEDPLIGGVISAAITAGVQKHEGRGTTIKHFCCNNQEFNRYMNNSIVSERALRDLYLKGFEISIRRCEPAALMTSYNLLNGIHTSERADLLKTVVRGEWGYRGLIMSDWVESGKSAKGNKYTMEWAADNVKAGNDITMEGSQKDYEDILTALQGRNSRVKLTRAEVEYCAAHVVDTAWRLAGENR